MKIEEELPSDTLLVYASPGYISNLSQVKWELEVDPGNWNMLFFTVKLPDNPNTLEFITNYFVKVNGIYNLVQADSLSVSITLSTEQFIFEIIQDINNLGVENDEKAYINNSIKCLEKIKLVSDVAKESNILNCLKAIEDIKQIQSVPINDIRLKLDMLLKILETR